VLLVLSAAALAAWLWIVCLPSRPYGTRERFEPESAGHPPDLNRVSVLIPARNEAAVVGRTLDALAWQGPGLDVLVVDDQSTDGTAAVCRERAAGLARDKDRSFALPIRVLEGEAPPAGWSGKLWALQQGLAEVDRPYVLMLDADIELAPGVVPGLLDVAQRRSAGLVSIMATLHCAGFWERLLVPPFVFFFKLLYPFARVNGPGPTAAAAGGCMLADAAALREAGAFTAIRAALIDDCTLAALLKRSGCPLWLGLSRSVVSLRVYSTLAEFWQMVARTAFTQLRCSVLLLFVTVAVLLAAFAAPAAALLAFRSPATMVAGGLALLAMGAVYAPVVRFYKLPLLWVFTLPAAAMLMMAMTVSSALNYWRGTRAQWKNRAYEVPHD
jgi:hopene-associated glycosyltransferase HpnB